MLNGCTEKQSSNKQKRTLITETHGTLKVQNNWQKKPHASVNGFSLLKVDTERRTSFLERMLYSVLK